MSDLAYNNFLKVKVPELQIEGLTRCEALMAAKEAWRVLPEEDRRSWNAVVWLRPVEKKAKRGAQKRPRGRPKCCKVEERSSEAMYGCNLHKLETPIQSLFTHLYEPSRRSPKPPLEPSHKNVDIVDSPPKEPQDRFPETHVNDIDDISQSSTYLFF